MNESSERMAVFVKGVGFCVDEGFEPLPPTALSLDTVVEQTLVKWDASIGDSIPDGDPARHPACIEVWKIPHGGQPELIYKRAE